jgi:hypothetical protein
MHRSDLKRAKKENRALDEASVARMEEEIRATYVQHVNELSNPESRKLFAAEPPVLDAVQQEILHALDTEGIAVVPFARLFPEALWTELCAASAAFETHIRAEMAVELSPGQKKKRKDAIEREASGERAVSKKTFLRRADIARAGSLTLQQPWLRLGASPRLLDIVNSRHRLWTKLTDVDQIYVTPVGAEWTRASSQRWHRDFNDQPVVKVFIYMSDVDEVSGPFEYVPESSQGRYAQEWPWGPLGDMYPDAEEFAQRIPATAARTILGPAGTVIFCETNGFHRGGFARDTRRVTGVLHYVSPASLASLVSRTFTVGELPADTPRRVRYALA